MKFSSDNPMRVYLADLCYLHDWDNNQPLPLNVGFIAAYLKKAHPEVEVELFKDPNALFVRLGQQAPDVLALSNYDWNARLNIPVLEYAKKAAPKTVTVMGGPNFQADDQEWMKGFFVDRPGLDVYISGEGEWSFMRLVELLEKSGKAFSGIPFEEYPDTFYSYDAGRGVVVNNPAHHVERLDLATVPSPYLTGLLDPFLKDLRLAPIIETNRGCPYSCTFCCWGQATQSKINQFPLDVVLKEIDYIADKCKNPSAFLYVADGNFGILARDQTIARAIQDCADKTGIPKRVYMYFAKNTNEAVLSIAEKMKSITSMSMSKQTMNPAVLENIKRKNIPVEQYDALRVECERRGIDTFCELIFCLAGETYQSFVDGVIATVRDGQRVTMYPQILLAGAESASPEYRRAHGFKTAYRVIPRYVSSYGDLHSLEYEEIVVETNALSRDDFYNIRLFQFLVAVLSGEAFAEFSRRLKGAGLDYATLANMIVHDGANWTPGLRALLEGYTTACRNELIEKKDVKSRFTADDIKNFKKAQLALIPFYMAQLATRADMRADLAAYLESMTRGRFAGRVDASAVDELALTLRLAFEKMICFDPLTPAKTVSHEYDFDAWLGAGDKASLSAHRLQKPVPYRYFIDPDVAGAFDRTRAANDGLTQTVYRLRVNMIGKHYERVFCYRRVPAESAAAQDTGAERRQAHSSHAETAVRH
jgi:hypothetical protein